MIMGYEMNAQEKIIKFLSENKGVYPASHIGYECLNVGARVRPQGAALAVSRHLRALEKRGFVKQTVRGWHILLF